jgi:hypothetical protein
MSEKQEGPEYELPAGVADTAVHEREVAENRLRTAEIGVERTNMVVDMLLASVRAVNELHVENGYAPKLRAIFRS